MNNEQNKNALMLQQAIELMPDNVRDQFVSNALKLMREASSPFRKLMAYYTCAMMEVETKLNVLNEEFSLQYDRNPSKPGSRALAASLKSCNAKAFP